MSDSTFTTLLISSLSLATLGYAAATPVPTLDLNFPAVFTGDVFGMDSTMMTIPIDTCRALPGNMQRHVGSISIPCFQTNGMKHVCSMYSDMNCMNLLSTWDRSHYRMIEHAEGENAMNAIGSQIVSIRCSMVDASLSAIAINSMEHSSTTHVSQCANDFCKSDADCHLNAEGYHYCSDLMNHTCQRARYIQQGDVCREDEECRTGYCSFGPGNTRRCAMKKGLNTLCSQSPECEPDLKCCREVMNTRGVCTASCRQQDEMLTTCVALGDRCFDDGACCGQQCKLQADTIMGVCSN